MEKNKNTGEFKKLSDFEKNLFLKRQVKDLVDELKRVKSGDALRETHVEMGKITSERDEWKDKYEELRKKRPVKHSVISNDIDYESLSPKQKKKVRYGLKDEVVNALQKQLGILQEVVTKRNVRIKELEGEWTRDEFMKFFRNDEKLATLSTDDRVEVFMHVLPGSSDITVERLNELISDYSVEGVTVIQRKWIADIREEYKKAAHERLGPNGYKELADFAITDFIALYISKIINPE